MNSEYILATIKPEQEYEVSRTQPSLISEKWGEFLITK
jgi:hypothetical protein